MKGYKISITFPANILNFLEGVCKKLTTVTIDGPDGNPIKNPQTGKFIYLSNTGGIEELIHGSILSAILPLIYEHKAFADEKLHINEFREEYGAYLTKMIEKQIGVKKAVKST